MDAHVSLMSLWLPILLSAVIVFVASSILHMVLPIHRNDLRKLPKEAEILETLRNFSVPPGDYGAPYAGGPAEMKNPDFVEKMKKGPLVFMTLSPGSSPAMGSYLAQWFVYCIVVSVFAAYMASRAVPMGGSYLAVFRFAGTTAFLCYAMSLPQNSIWFRRNWGTTIKSMADGLLYGLLTAGTFGWLWPR